jgi:hypothetical protein
MLSTMDRVGQVIGRLTVIKFLGRVNNANKNNSDSLWLCRCSCPKQTEIPVKGKALTSRHKKSCGCLKWGEGKATLKAEDQERYITSREYRIWVAMISRCHNPNAKDYKNYGARGIKVCYRWRYGENGLSGYECFILDMGYRPFGDFSIDRINNDGAYEPGNCKWATRIEQMSHTRRSKFLTINGETKILAEWARIVNVSEFSIRHRLNRGWSPEDALSIPVRKTKRSRDPIEDYMISERSRELADNAT